MEKKTIKRINVSRICWILCAVALVIAVLLFWDLHDGIF